MNDTMTGEEYNERILKNMSETQYLNHVMQLAREWGWMVDHVFDQGSKCPECGRRIDTHAKRSIAGAPDIFAMRQHEFFWLELKAEKGKVSAHQVVYMDMLVKAQADVFYARPSDYSKVEKLFDGSPHCLETMGLAWTNVREREIGMMSKRERKKLEALA